MSLPDERRAASALVIVAASAGSLEPIRRLLASLPASFPAAIALVQHRSPEAKDHLTALLARGTALRVKRAMDGDTLEGGTVYVCPPGMHMTAEASLRLHPGPRIECVRPSANRMFASAARTFGGRAIGVVLSGRGTDAAVGTLRLVDAGGAVLAQTPASCAYPDMPLATIASGLAEAIPLENLGAALVDLVESAATPHRKPTGGTLAAPPADAVRRTTVLLADDHRIILDGLRALLRAAEDIDVIGEAEDGRAAVRLAAELDPDVVVMDLGMPDLNGVEATRRIRGRNRRTNVVALSARADVEAARQALAAGALGYVSKNGAFAELSIAIRMAAAGRRFVSPGFASVLQSSGASGAARRPHLLTPTERELVQLTVEGKPTAQIAKMVGWREDRVDAERTRVMHKLGVDGFLGLIRWALREGIVSVDT